MMTNHLFRGKLDTVALEVLEMPDHMLPEGVRNLVSDYLSELDTRMPKRLEAFYVVGSLALNDYQPLHSDVDFVSVLRYPPTTSEIENLREIHGTIGKKYRMPNLDGLYVTWENLQRPPDECSPPYYLDGRFFASGAFAANPVTWYLLSRSPLTVRGTRAPHVHSDEQQLRQWCKDNLKSYWSRWVFNARRRPKHFLHSLTQDACTWGVLGVVRLHATIQEMKVISKSEAAAYALSTFPATWHPIILAALDGRTNTGNRPRLDPFHRRATSLSFMEYVIEDALR